MEINKNNQFIIFNNDYKLKLIKYLNIINQFIIYPYKSNDIELI